MNHIIAVLTVIAAYLIGSVNFAVIFTRKFNNVDVRDFGSGNAGTTNVLRVSGAKAGIATFVLDILKGAVAAGLGLVVFSALYQAQYGQLLTSYYSGDGTEFSPFFNPIYGKYLCGLACMLGHCFPIFFGFRGGKAVATSVGIFAVCCPIVIILGLIGFGISLAISKIVSLSSLIATLIVVAGCAITAFTGEQVYATNPVVVTIIAACCGLIVYLRHLENIKRLINGTEKKFTVKKEKSNG